ncbi:unnamed protein product [Diplocarpon coronariae]
MYRVTHILSSPLRRTLHTTLIAFKPIIVKGLQVIAFTGSEMGTVIRELYSKQLVSRDCIDATLVPDGSETNHEGDEPEEIVLESLYLLGLEATKNKGGVWEGHAVSQGKDVEIVVSAHSALIMDLVGKYFFVCHNNPYKSYEFPTEDMVKTGVPYYNLIETEESKVRIRTFP